MELSSENFYFKQKQDSKRIQNHSERIFLGNQGRFGLVWAGLGWPGLGWIGLSWPILDFIAQDFELV